MGRFHALEAIQLRKTERIPIWHEVPPTHPKFLEKLTGLDPFSNPREAALRTIEQLELDVSDYWEQLEPSTLQGSETREIGGGKTAAAFHPARWEGSRGGDTIWQNPSQDFQSVEDVLDYDVTQHPLCKTTDEFEVELKAQLARIQEHRRVLADRAWVFDPPDWYDTVFMWGVSTFGWELFMMAATLEPERYSLLLDAFTSITLRYFTAAARLEDLRAVQAHDDLCITRGPVFSPDWYRKHVFPRYPKVLAPVMEKGVKVIYRGDGNIGEFVDDLAAAGFDGFFVRSETDLGAVARKYGSSKVIIGNINTTILTLKGKREIEEDVRRCVKQAGDCPGYFFHIAGGIPVNVPVDNIFYVFEAMKKYGRR